MNTEELNQLLVEIETIIGRIGRYDVGENKLTAQGRHELTQLFREKIKQACELKRTLTGSFKRAS